MAKLVCKGQHDKLILTESEVHASIINAMDTKRKPIYAEEVVSSLTSMPIQKAPSKWSKWSKWLSAK